MTVRSSTILGNILNVLADNRSMTARGLSGVVHCLELAGVKGLTTEKMVVALDEVVVHQPSVFLDQQPPYRKRGSEFYLDNPNHDAARACIMAIYAVTDLLPRIQVPMQDSTVGFERIRPKAFTICQGHLMQRWAQGNFSIPQPHTIVGWFHDHPEFMAATRESSNHGDTEWCDQLLSYLVKAVA